MKSTLKALREFRSLEKQYGAGNAHAYLRSARTLEMLAGRSKAQEQKNNYLKLAAAAFKMYENCI